MKPSLEQVIYTAAALDAEATVGISKASTGGAPFVKMAQTNYDWLHWFKTMWGGSVSEAPRRSPKHSRQWVWHIGGHPIVPLLNATKPYLRLKVAQADLCLELQRRIDGRIGTMPGKKGYRLTSAERLFRYDLYKQCQALNKRGPKTEDTITKPAKPLSQTPLF